jgi:hypothetical protein
LAFLWTVDATEADTLRVGAVQDFEGVAVEEGDDRTGEVSPGGAQTQTLSKEDQTDNDC